jgi:alpha-L-rhamnosidase
MKRKRGIAVLTISLAAGACFLVRPYPVSSPAPGGIVARGLRCEYRVDPLGIDSPRPRLSWILVSIRRAEIQTAYRVLVADSLESLNSDRGSLWDSGKVGSRETLHIVYDGKPLRSGMRCFWKVRVWDGGGAPSDWSRPAFWETAILDPSDWKGRWIEDGKPLPGRDEDFYGDDPAPLFRKSFVLPPGVVRARLYITGLGYYEAFLNGRRVGDQVLDPGWTNYQKRVYYSAYDVTGLLREGQNAIGVAVGNGWYNPLPLRLWGSRNLRQALPVGRPRLFGQLQVEFEDGSRITVATDSTWKVRGGPLLRNNVYLGEVYDARREVPGWDSPGLDDEDWEAAVLCPDPAGPLQAQPQPPIRITARIRPVALTEPKPGVFIFDLGRNFAGWASLRLCAPAGTPVKIRFGELLYPDGSLNPMTGVCGQIKGKDKEGALIGGPGSPEIAEPSDTYIAKGGGEEIYTPRFTFHGFRYAEVSGLPAAPKPDDLEGLRLNSDVVETGTFTCSNDLLNRIQEMTRRTFLSNIFSVQSDCPHREKFGYGGDLVATSDAFLLNFGMEGFYAKAAGDWSDAVRPDGMLTDTAPFVGIQYCGLAWAMAHPLLQAQLVRYYGDRRLVEEQYEASRRWLDLVVGQNPDFIIRDGLSDHESLTPTDVPVLVTPLFYQTAGIVSSLARLLEKRDDSVRYAGLADSIRTAYLERVLAPGPDKFMSMTRTGLAAALELGLLPAEERGAAEQALVGMVLAAPGPQVTTGIFGTKFLLNALSRAGRADLAFELVNRREFPGWGYMLARGATTLWEHWDFSDNTFSHNHPMFGSVSEWFFQWLAGIQPAPDAVGFDRIVIRPQPVGGLEWVKGGVLTVRGEVRSEWRIENGRFILDVAIPPNATALVYVPSDDPQTVREGKRPAVGSDGVRYLRWEQGAAVFEIGSGRYSFAAALPESVGVGGQVLTYNISSALFMNIGVPEGKVEMEGRDPLFQNRNRIPLLPGGNKPLRLPGLKTWGCPGNTRDLPCKNRRTCSPKSSACLQSPEHDQG